jgi:hypothetical protein
MALIVEATVPGGKSVDAAVCGWSTQSLLALI